ncbi:transcriptional regulator [Brevibacterium casei]|uniref:WYL domain-containing protein n=1 Tax=Brevibacterium TaxID=1696 RepID=UPI001431AB56|nr:transcriptional regulator [Brevibacterium sp. LS14]
MRADRLLALLLFLQSREQVTAAEVAAELEVSLATARRDLEALSAAGVPVHVWPGRGGGWGLLGGARTNLTGLGGPEARSLFWMLGTAGLSDPDTRLATRKLIRALPESLRSEAEVLATTIHYDHTPWSRTPMSDDAVRDRLEALRAALIGDRLIEAEYTSRDGTRRRIALRPFGLVAKAGVWYLVADPVDTADTGDGARTYRVDRLGEVVVEPPRPDGYGAAPRSGRPRDFDLAGFWARHVAEVESLRSSVTARIRCPAWTLPILEAQFGRYLTVVTEEDDIVIVTVGAHLVVALAEQLAGWGRTIEVLDPPEVRTELARIGAELTDAYSHSPTDDTMRRHPHPTRRTRESS